jgi:ABC-type sugar transport system substrate-binding protein
MKKLVIAVLAVALSATAALAQYGNVPGAVVQGSSIQTLRQGQETPVKPEAQKPAGEEKPAVPAEPSAAKEQTPAK